VTVKREFDRHAISLEIIAAMVVRLGANHLAISVCPIFLAMS
jgi:hypothetical protein